MTRTFHRRVALGAVAASLRQSGASAGLAAPARQDHRRGRRAPRPAPALGGVARRPPRRGAARRQRVGRRRIGSDCRAGVGAGGARAALAPRIGLHRRSVRRRRHRLGCVGGAERPDARGRARRGLRRGRARGGCGPVPACPRGRSRCAARGSRLAARGRIAHRRQRRARQAPVAGPARQVARPARGGAGRAASAQSDSRTAASPSPNVGSSLGYQAARRCGRAPRVCGSRARRATGENSLGSAGAARATAASDLWHWVSTPRFRRATANVTSTDQRRTNQPRTSAGSAPTFVQRGYLRQEDPARVGHEQPAQGHRGQAGVVPNGRPGGDLVA